MPFHWLASAVLQPCPRLVDLGCGTGDLTANFTSVAEQVIGVDSSLDVLRTARANHAVGAQLSFVAADVRTLPLKDWDCVVATFSAHHFFGSDVFDALRGGLRSRGTVIILDVFGVSQRGYWYYVFDQLFLGALRNLAPISASIRELGWQATTAPWVYRLKWLTSDQGRRHSRADEAMGILRSLEDWQVELTRAFPNGKVRVLFGSCLYFTWGSAT